MREELANLKILFDEAALLHGLYMQTDLLFCDMSRLKIYTERIAEKTILGHGNAHSHSSLLRFNQVKKKKKPPKLKKPKKLAPNIRFLWCCCKLPNKKKPSQAQATKEVVCRGGYDHQPGGLCA